MSKEQVRERIAKLLALQTLCDEDRDTIDLTWEWVVKYGFVDEYLVKADLILSDPDILIKAEDQSLPENFYLSMTPEWPRIYKKAQQDMLNQGWVKVEEK